MENSKHTPEADTREVNKSQPDEPSAPGDVLGLSRFTPAPAERTALREQEDEEENALPPDERERGHIGSRDVTEGTTGGTGPDTGGTGVYRKGSGATGTDIGK